MDAETIKSPHTAGHGAEAQQDSFADILIELAQGSNLAEAGTPVENKAVPISKLVARLTNHAERASKLGSYFCCPMSGSSRNGTNAQPWRLFCFDFDGKAGAALDPEKSKVFFAPWLHVGYSTYSYTSENGKHRVVLVLDREVDPAEYRELYDAWAELCPFEPDSALNHPDQPVFFPSCPPGAERLAWVNEGDFFGVDTFLDDYRAQRTNESRAENGWMSSGDSVIAAFNSAHSVNEILERNAYQRRGKRYQHPNSESGIPGLSILKDGRLCFSHANDLLADGKPHDAFDCWRILEGKGDARQAVKEAAKLLGIQWKPDAMGKEQAKESGADQEITWATPKELPTAESLFPVPEFDYSLLPESLRGWVADISERMQCPPEFVAVGALVSLSGVIGRKVCIRPKRYDSWKVVPNLWGACVGRPGVMKSPALTEAMLPLRRLEAEANEAFDSAVNEFEGRKELNGIIAEARKSDAKKLVKAKKLEEAERLLLSLQGDGEEPVRRRFVVTDATVEALSEILQENPWGLLAYRDELSGLLMSLDREGQESARSFYLQSYDGNQSWTSDRIMRGRNQFIEAVCLSMLGSIQPGKLGPYVRNAVHGGAGDDGLLQRFGMIVFPVIGSEWKNVDRYPDKDAKNKAFAVFARLAGLEPGENPIEMRFSPEAQEIFEEWRQGFEVRLRRGDMSPALESHFSKYRKLVPALALVCALADDEQEVGDGSLLRALAWCDLLRSHALKVYGIGTSDVEGAKALLSKIKDGKVNDEFAVRDVQKKGWTYLTETKEVRGAADCLEQYGYLYEVVEQTPGRARSFYRINPEVLPS